MNRDTGDSLPFGEWDRLANAHYNVIATNLTIENRISGLCFVIERRLDGGAVGAFRTARDAESAIAQDKLSNSWTIMSFCDALRKVH